MREVLALGRGRHAQCGARLGGIGCGSNRQRADRARRRGPTLRGDRRLHVLPDGSNQRLLREHVTAPSWSPDGRRIMVTAYGAGEYGDYLKHGVYVMNADGSCLTLVTGGAGSDWQPVANVAPGAPPDCVDLVLSAKSVGVTGLRGASYSLVVTNEGTRRATDVRLVQRFDSDVEIGRTSQQYCSASGAVVACRSDVMEPRQALAVAVVARPHAAGPLTADVSSSATEETT